MLTVGTIFQDKYEILEILGEGGMGSVYKVRQMDANRIMALKLLHAILVEDPESIKRFHREAKALSRLRHRNIVTFYHFGFTDEGMPFAGLEYLEGKSLYTILGNEQHISPARAMNIMHQVCDALAFAHELGIVHRDLKPGNIVLLDTPEPDSVKVIDFGLAKLAAKSGLASGKITKTGLLMGSVSYMSPEQANGMPVDARSDVYSCGCVLFEMITGQQPFEADNPIGLLFKHSHQSPPLFESTLYGKGCPARLESVCRKAMEKEPDKRYQNMFEFMHDLKVAETGEGVLLAGTDAGSLKADSGFADNLFGALLSHGSLGLKSSINNQKPVQNLLLIFIALIAISVLACGLKQWWLSNKHIDFRDISRQGEQTKEQARDREAKCLKDTLLRIEKRCGPDDQRLATNLYDLAHNYRGQHKYAEAEPILKRLLAIREKAPDASDPDLVECLYILGHNYRDLRKFKDAEPLYQRALTIREKALGSDDFEVGNRLIDLGNNYRNLHEYREAESLLKRALAIMEKSLDPYDQVLADDLLILADAIQELHRYKEAEQLYKRALAIKEKASGPDHFGVVFPLLQLTVIYVTQGRNLEAEPLKNRALAAIARTPVLPDDPQTARLLTNLANKYSSQGKDLEAEPLYQCALAFGEKVSGPDQPGLITKPLESLAGIYRKQGKSDLAAQMESRLKAARTSRTR